jgi:tetratricopeptide (TPR) repeat protein
MRLIKKIGIAAIFSQIVLFSFPPKNDLQLHIPDPSTYIKKSEEDKRFIPMEEVPQVYQDVSFIKFNDIATLDDNPKEKIPLLDDLERIVKETEKRLSKDIDDPDSFYNMVEEKAREYTKEFQLLTPYALVYLSFKIVCNQMSYEHVDTMEFKEKHGIKEHRYDSLFRMGLGDCDKYSALTVLAFNHLKKYAKDSCANIYMTENIGGGELSHIHRWNTIIISGERGIYLSHIDPTFFDGGQSIDSPIDEITAYATLLQELGFYKASNDIIDELSKPAELLYTKAKNYRSMGEYDKAVASYIDAASITKKDHILDSSLISPLYVPEIDPEKRIVNLVTLQSIAEEKKRQYPLLRINEKLAESYK